MMDTKIIGEGKDAYQISRSNRYSSRHTRVKGNLNFILIFIASHNGHSQFVTHKRYLRDGRYVSHFWSALMKDPLFCELEEVENKIEEEHAESVFTLYQRLKEIFCITPEYTFNIDSDQVKEIHYLLDKTFENMVTNTQTTEAIFKELENYDLIGIFHLFLYNFL